jgi:uncharacterized protein
MHDPFKTPGAFSWNELMTTDPVAAKSFYGELFGWQTEEMNMDNGMTYTVVKTADGEGIGGIMGMPPGAPAPAWGAYITVTDTDETIAKATSLGAQVVLPPQDIPGVGRMAWFRDPQGAVIAVIAYVMK